MNEELIFILHCIRESMCDYTEDEWGNDTTQFTITDELCSELVFGKCSTLEERQKVKNYCENCLLGYRNNTGYASQVIIVIKKLI